MKIFVVNQISNVNGSMFYTSIPCATLQAAQRVVMEIVKDLKKGHYKNLDINGTNEYFAVDKEETAISIDDLYENHSERFYINEESLIQ